VGEILESPFGNDPNDIDLILNADDLINDVEMLFEKSAVSQNSYIVALVLVASSWPLAGMLLIQLHPLSPFSLSVQELSLHTVQSRDMSCFLSL
jgi:hypothetical protein